MQNSNLKLTTYKLPTWLPITILASGGLLRLVGLTVSPLWYDEAFCIYLTRFPQWMVQIEYSDFNPPLWQLVVSPFIWLLGETELAVRLPALLASLAALWVAWLLARDLLPSGKLVPAALLLAFLPYHIWLAQDGRCYALLALLYVSVLWFGLKGRWLGFGACLGLLFYTHSTGLFYGAAAGLGLLVLRPKDWKPITAAGLLAGMAMLPWLSTYFSRVGDHWLGPLTVEELWKAVYFATFAGALPPEWAYLAIWLILVSVAAGLVVTFLRWKDRGHLALTIWALGPLVMLLVVAIFKNLIFYRPLSAMLLPMCIWLPAALWPSNKRQWAWGGWVLPYLWALVLLVGLISWTPGLKGSNLREAAQQINQQWQPGDVVYHATGTSYLPMSLYLNEPGYVIDEHQHDGLLQTRLQVLFGVPRAALEDVPHSRAWVVWSKDPIMSTTAINRMASYTAGAQLVDQIVYWQAADIEIYLVEK